MKSAGCAARVAVSPLVAKGAGGNSAAAAEDAEDDDNTVVPLWLLKQSNEEQVKIPS